MGMHDTLSGPQANGFSGIEKLCDVKLKLWSGDFGFSNGDPDDLRFRQRQADKIVNLAMKGVAITLSWHQCNPVVGEPCSFQSGVQGHLSDVQWNELLTPGTELNEQWEDNVDKLAIYLEIFSEQHITVFLRPYHEGNVSNFWWGGQPKKYIKLWQLLHTYLEDYFGFRNIQWVWSVDANGEGLKNIKEFYPGDKYVDVIGADVYPDKGGSPDFSKVWRFLKAVSDKKPIALTEVSQLPSSADLRKHPWAYVVPWGIGLLETHNTKSEICRLYR